MWQAIRENPRAVAYAVLMHMVLLLLLVFSLDWTPKSIKPGSNKPIQAELVDASKLQAIEEKKQAEQRKLDEQKRQAEQALKQKAEAERKRQAEEAAKKKAAAEKQRQAEQAAKEKAAKEKAAAEAAAKREAEQALQAQLAEEHAQARAESALSQYIPYIQEKIQRNWLRPAGTPAGMSCLILVKLIPGGEVVSAKVVRSSGNLLFDRSVETAVLKASPLPLPDDATMFKYFREINFNFKPDS